MAQADSAPGAKPTDTFGSAAAVEPWNPAAGSYNDPANPDASEPDAGEPLTLSWLNNQGHLVGLSLFNIVLRILTLGIYHFWGKTEVRKRIWSSVRLQGEPFEYTGTGKELFLGFVIVFFVVLLPLALASFAIQLFISSKELKGFLTLAMYAGIFLLVGMGTYRAQRYRMSRTRWRGIRGSVTAGRSLMYGLVYVGTAILIPFTLGWIIPWRECVLQRFITNEMKFGNRPLHFTGTAGPLYRRYWAVWLAAIVTYIGLISALGWMLGGKVEFSKIGGIKWDLVAKDYYTIAAAVFVALLFYALIKAWYSAGLINYFASQTWYGRAKFKGSATALSLVWLTFTNTLIVIFSLGILAPIAQLRFMNYYVSRLDIDGNVPLERVGQNEEELVARGEGLATAFDIDAFG